MITMSKAFPKEFRNDVVAVALKRELPFAQVVKDFEISESSVQRWVKIAEVDGGRRSGVSTGEKKGYLCAMKDVLSNRIVGYSIADRTTS